MKVKNLVYTGLILALPALSYASDISVGINLGGAGVFIHEAPPPPRVELSLIHISEPTRPY